MRRLWPIFVVLIYTAVGRADAAPAKAVTSLLGVEIGKPLALPKCATSLGPRQKIGLSVEPRCIVFAHDILHGPGHPRRATIYFGSSPEPIYSRYSSFDVVVTDSGVQNITYFTYGVTRQDDVLRDMKAKFGPPTHLKTETMQNGFGAKFEVIRADWRRGDVWISFNGALKEMDTGAIDVTTDAEASRNALDISAMQSGL